MAKQFCENENLISTNIQKNFIPFEENSFVCRHYLSENVNTAIHHHDYFEIEIIISGKATHILNGNKFEIKKGFAYFLNPADFHELLIAKGDHIELLNISFDMFFIDAEIIFDIINTFSQSVIEIGENDFDFILALSERIITEYKESKFMYNGSYYISAYKKNKNIYGDAFIKNSIEIIIILLMRAKKNFTDLSDKNIMLNKDLKLLQKILVYIHSHFKKDITLDDIAEYTLLSKSSLCNIFKKAKSKTIVQYINELRLSYSARLLEAYNLSISEICYECGYKTLPHFLRDFKKVYGTSPLKYKNAKIENS